MLGEIGRGGVGVVYKGRDQDLGRDVAMKVLKDEYARHPDVLARFVEEAQIGGQLQHPGIVPVYELGLQADERPYFAMKLVKGETLQAQLARRDDPAKNRRRFLGIFEQVCQTIAYAHARRVIHRDLKPANIMIGAFGEVQVVDWGFAKVLPKGGVADEVKSAQRASQRSVIETARSTPGSGSHSQAGSMLGTPAYISPGCTWNLMRVPSHSITRSPMVFSAFGSKRYARVSIIAPVSSGSTVKLPSSCERTPASIGMPQRSHDSLMKTVHSDSPGTA